MPVTSSLPFTTNIKWIFDTHLDKLNDQVAQVLIQTLKKCKYPVIGFATGSSPLGVYRILVQQSRKDPELMDRWKHIISFNLDEYVGLDEHHPQSYTRYMWDNLFCHLPVDKARIHIPNGMATIESACKDYQKKLASVHGTDLQILGIGQNGHIGFNEPDDKMMLHTHITNLLDTTRNANARFFASKNDVPAKAITMGIGDIFRAKQILLLAYGKGKKAALTAAFSGAISPHCPASFLQLHPDVTIFTDQSLPVSHSMNNDT